MQLFIHHIVPSTIMLQPVIVLKSTQCNPIVITDIYGCIYAFPGDVESATTLNDLLDHRFCVTLVPSAHLPIAFANTLQECAPTCQWIQIKGDYLELDGIAGFVRKCPGITRVLDRDPTLLDCFLRYTHKYTFPGWLGGFTSHTLTFETFLATIAPLETCPDYDLTIGWRDTRKHRPRH